GIAIDRGPGHEEILQYAVLHRIDAARPDPLVVVSIGAEQISAAIAAQRGVKSHRQKIGQDGLTDHFSKCLTFGFALLPMAFDAVAEYLMEKHRGCATGQDGGTREWIDERGFA